MATTLEMPRYGATMEEGMIAKWLVAEGAAVTAGQVLCSIEIEKLTNDLESPVSGILRKIYVAEGESAACGAPIALIAAAGEDASAPAESRAEQAKPAAPEAPRSDQAVPSSLGRPSISPKAAQLAEELGLDWSTITGTGRLGMVTRDDLRSALASGGAKAAQQPLSRTGEGESDTGDRSGALSGARRVIGMRMMESLRQSPQAAIWMDADVTELMQEYRRTKASLAGRGIHLSLTAVILKALASVLKDHPACRTCLAADGSLQLRSKIDIAVAVDSPTGLLVPVLRDLDLKTASQIALELTSLAERARKGALSPDEMAGHTMTVSNLGMYGVTYMQTILNLPESVLLGVGASDLRPVYRDGGIFPREILPLSLTFDHRILDGGPAAAFLRDVCRALVPALIEKD